MTAAGTAAAQPGSPSAAGAGTVLRDLARRQIQRALSRRTRYRYVKPRVEAEGQGWKIVSPNCSRRVASDGGDIPIALLLAGADGAWTLYARDHGRACWEPRHSHTRLAALLALLLVDARREFWQ